jgi:hypothetical protein
MLARPTGESSLARGPLWHGAFKRIERIDFVIDP